MAILPDDFSPQLEKSSFRGALHRFVRGRLIVRVDSQKTLDKDGFESKCNEVVAAAPSARLGAAEYENGRIVVEFDPDTDIDSVADDLQRLDMVELVEPDFIAENALVPNDRHYLSWLQDPQNGPSGQWGFRRINAEGAWDIETGKRDGVLIGVIDGGLSMNSDGRLDHPELNEPGRFVLGQDHVDGLPVPRDTNGHGTHVTGIAASVGNNGMGVCGMNWATRVYICRWTDGSVNGSGTYQGLSEAIREVVDYARSKNLNVVINISGGGTAPNQDLRDACAYADQYGAIICACTHNDGGPVRWPAAFSTTFPGIIAVGSTDNTDTVAPTSNFGPEVTVVAPGVHILSTLPAYEVAYSRYIGIIPLETNYGVMSGTSMATPFVTGLASLIWSHYPNLTASQVKDRITSTAVKLGPGNFDPHWGFGRIDAQAALS